MHHDERALSNSGLCVVFINFVVYEILIKLVLIYCPHIQSFLPQNISQQTF